MSIRFTPNRGLIVVSTKLDGPTGSAVLRLALDTGATVTLVNTSMLVALGYDPAATSDRVEMTTGSGIEFAPRIEVSGLSALGQQRSNFSVLAHTLPPSAGVDGLLGLDFFSGLKLTIDFRDGNTELV